MIVTRDFFFGLGTVVELFYGPNASQPRIGTTHPIYLHEKLEDTISLMG